MGAGALVALVAGTGAHLVDQRNDLVIHVDPPCNRMVWGVGVVFVARVCR